MTSVALVVAIDISEKADGNRQTIHKRWNAYQEIGRAEDSEQMGSSLRHALHRLEVQRC